MAALTVARAAGSLRCDHDPAYRRRVLRRFWPCSSLSPELNSLAVLGPDPTAADASTASANQVETLLLAPGARSGGDRRAGWLVPLGGARARAVGWSKAGADGGGILVFAAALGVLGSGCGARAHAATLAIAARRVVCSRLCVRRASTPRSEARATSRARSVRARLAARRSRPPPAPLVGRRTTTGTRRHLPLFGGVPRRARLDRHGRPRRATVDAMLVGARGLAARQRHARRRDRARRARLRGSLPVGSQ